MIRTCVRLLLAALFCIAGALKAADPAALLQAIENYRLVPRAVAMAGAYYLPYLEIVCGAGLLSRRLRGGALALLGGLLLLFMAALASAGGRGLNIACGCFGEDGEPGRYAVALARDAALLAAVAFAAREKAR